MPTPTKGPRLGGSPAHQRHILANLATALFEHGKITTTEAKARRLRPFAERLITFAKRGDLHARRQVLTVMTDKGGGYTRITKIGPRKGDNAPLAIIELVPEEATASPRRRRARRAQPAPASRAARPAAEETATAEDAATAEDTTAEDAAAVEDTAEAEADDTAEAGADDTAEAVAPDAAEDDAAGEDAGDGAEGDGK